ncbi:MAG: tRNA uridine(34) 5-carboxymethylaminomethyl modification radical SAM/GNAT enzyme Elp3 [Patescibacteria group bacterium]|nr:tRNA uridine(34) 5-carboxymethylaminomethyl modification radical SAM/GNAT enzyme Elp3 [Patescibacteria group bacterium]
MTAAKRPAVNRSGPQTTAIIEASLAGGKQTRSDLDILKRRFAKRSDDGMASTTDLRRAYDTIIKQEPSRRNVELEKLLVRRGVRSLSGVAVVTALTKPFPCPGRCVYCPSEARMPKSYLANEPAAARALSLKFDARRQITTRLETLRANGHPTDKMELIIKGGTWSAYGWDYRRQFIKDCFDAANVFGRRAAAASRTLEASQLRNETAKSRIIGLTLETRPDFVRPEEIKRLRELGCTRIELGVQALDDRVLKLVKRGHDVETVARATRLLKNAGFKVDYHLMPQLPGATPASDLAELRRVFADADFRPDMIKIYPCVVLETAELYDWFKRGEYRPYSDRQLLDLLTKFKTEVPRYCRISRLIRDIPSTSIIAGNPVTNLRQVIAEKMRAENIHCACLRCREIGHVMAANPQMLRAKPKLFDEAYEASGGTEHFLSFEDASRRAVFAFCRLRLPPPETDDGVGRFLPELKNVALLRELHTYGQHLQIAHRETGASQHTGLGRRLLAEAEKIAHAAGYEKMAVISGVGVRGYYRKFGYRREGTYLVKHWR